MSGCQASDFAVEDKSLCAETHLAVARRQSSGTGILGLIERERECMHSLFSM